MGDNPSWFSRQGPGKDAVKNIADADLKHFPVENVSWLDVQAFVRKLNEQQKGKGWRYRLPTGAEWEYTCRNAATSREECSYDFYFDKPTNDLSSAQANIPGDGPVGQGAKGPTLGRTAKVGSYAPNKLGLYDMHGNVAQWCDDPVGTRSDQWTRGSGWDQKGATSRAAGYTYYFGPSERHSYIGFRLARVPSGAK